MSWTAATFPTGDTLTMNADFQDAARRHHTDALLLDQRQRYGNADHLYGIAAECMLKAIMVGLGAPVSNRGNPQDQAHRTHINELWGEFCAFVGGAGGSSYLPFPSHHRPFADWNVSQRYAPQRLFTDGWLKSKRRREEVAAIAASLQAAILDGIID
jgi:hypothetical protein